MSTKEGIIFGIQRFSIHDGPGIRTTVFLKGCNMRCSWCHNPESYRPAPVLAFNQALCAGCRACERVCPQGAHLFGDGHSIRRDLCAACGLCAKSCPGKALEVIGSRTTPDLLMAQIIKDKRYYATSGGGVTFSGGEALLQLDFVAEMLDLCKKEGLHTVVETNGSLPFDRYERVLPLVDLFLVDYKLTDEQLHRQHTGLGRAAVLENIAKLHAVGAKMLLRCPIIPDVNDNDAHFAAIAQLTRDYPGLMGAELLAYHNLGVSKADRIGMDYKQFTTPAADALEGWKQRVREQEGRVFEGF